MSAAIYIANREPVIVGLTMGDFGHHTLLSTFPLSSCAYEYGAPAVTTSKGYVGQLS